MLYIDGNTIRLTRGDTAFIHIPLTTAEGVYEMDPTDTLTFSVKKTTRDTEYIFQKENTGDNVFHIEPSDTSSVAFGKYTYDVQLSNNDGDVFTVIPPSTFEVLAEVTC
jgi:hypothetical protein